MSYARFGDDSDVYVFTAAEGLECCGCILQARQYVEDSRHPLGGYLESVGEIVPHVFRSNAMMIEHLMLHREKGHIVPERALERLRDPEDAAENEAIWAKYAR